MSKVKEDIKKEVEELYHKIDLTKIEIKEQQECLREYKEQLKEVKGKLDNITYYERKEEIQQCHEEITDIIEGLGYNFKGGNNSIRIFGEIRNKEDFRDNLRIKFNNTPRCKTHYTGVDILNDEKIIEQVRTIINKYNIKCVRFVLCETHPYYHTYTVVKYDKDFRGEIQPHYFGRDKEEVWKSNETVDEMLGIE